MLVSFAVAKAACSGFSNLEYSLIWLIYIHKHIRDKVNQYHFNSKVQHSQKIPTSSKRQSKKKKKTFQSPIPYSQIFLTFTLL